MSRTDAWMPLYIADYLADTRRLSVIQHGAYMLLLMEYWRHGPLPDDHRELMAIVQADKKVWERDIWPGIGRFFHREDDGLLHQKRIDAERTKAADISNKRAAAARQRGIKTPASAEQMQSKSSANAEQKEPNAGARQSQSPSPTENAGLRPEPSGSPSAPPEPMVAKQNNRPVRDIVWTDGLAAVRRMTGLSEARARGVVGQLCKAARDDCSTVMRVINEAEDLRPGVPVAWMTAALTRKKPDPWAAAFETMPLVRPNFDLEMTTDEHGAYHLSA